MPTPQIRVDMVFLQDADVEVFAALARRVVTSWLSRDLALMDQTGSDILNELMGGAAVPEPVVYRVAFLISELARSSVYAITYASMGNDHEQPAEAWQHIIKAMDLAGPDQVRPAEMPANRER